MEPARCREHNHVGIAFGKQGGETGVSLGAVLFGGFQHGCGFDVANGYQLSPIAEMLECGKVILRDATAADKRKADSAVLNRWFISAQPEFSRCVTVFVLCGL